MQKKLTVKTPNGSITAEPSGDLEYPGIWIIAKDENGQEYAACLFEYHQERERTELRVYGPDDPDGDPIAIHIMSKTTDSKEETDSKK